MTLAANRTIPIDTAVAIESTLLVDGDRGQTVGFESEGDVVITRLIVTGGGLPGGSPATKMMRLAQVNGNGQGVDIIITAHDGDISIAAEPCRRLGLVMEGVAGWMMPPPATRRPSRTISGVWRS